MSQGSVSKRIAQLKEGDAEALQWLWERYRPQLMRLARQFLKSAPRRSADESDVAAGVLESLWRSASSGRLERLSSREELWALLVTLTRQKAVSQVRRELRVKRGGGRVRTEAELDQRGASTRLDDHAGDGPSPELLAIMAEEHERLLGLLRDDRLRLVAVLKLLGHSHEEIGQLLGVSVRTVIRKLNLIRDTWDGEVST